MKKEAQTTLTVVGVVIGCVGVALSVFPLFALYDKDISSILSALMLTFQDYGIAFSYIVWLLFLTIYATLIFYERVNGRNLAATSGELETKNYSYTLWIWGGLALVVQHATLILGETRPLLSIAGSEWRLWIASLLLGVLGFYWLVRGRVYIDGYWTAHIYRYKEQRVVADGAYSRVRHPIYCGQIYIAVAIWIACNNWWLVFLPVMTILYNWMRASREEMELDRILGGAYTEYRKKVPCFLLHPL